MSGKRIAVLISGRGSNLQAFIDAITTKQLDAEISLVLSNRPDAAGLERAASIGIATGCVNHREFSSREDFDSALVTCLDEYNIDLVILAGFMRILTPVFIDAFAGRLLNIHPSLLPKYPGLNTHQRALDAGDTQAGATVHFVTAELDGGPAILQAAVPITEHDTADTLAQRIIIEEHCIYPIAAKWFLGGRLKLTEQGAIFDGQILPSTGVANRDV
ncbi:MAG: phosphoribosylglycinamide formyltransferase-1 [Halioglobus sp.]|jgi:phosphoribosylglycinamide formyltransferase-1